MISDLLLHIPPFAHQHLPRGIHAHHMQGWLCNVAPQYAKYLDTYFCTFLLSHSQQYQWETLAQNIREFLSRYLGSYGIGLAACSWA